MATVDRPRLVVSALAGASVLAIVLMAAVVASGQRGGTTLVDNPWTSGPALAAALAAVASFVTGLVAVLRHHERARIVMAAVLVEGLVTVFLVGELASAP